MPTIVTMPKWGLTMVSGTVTGWSHEEGDTVTEGAALLTVETEKAVDDVEAPASGILRKIVAPTGSEVPVTGPVAVIVAPDEELSDEALTALLATSAGPAATAGAGQQAQRPARESRKAARDASGRVNASPAARKRAGELGIDLATIEATGPGGRITSEDVERAAASVAATAAAPRSEQVTLDNGNTVSVLVAGPVDAPETIVFLHGLGGSQSTWANVLGNFAETYRVAAVDLPGHGASDKPASENGNYAITSLANAVAQVIEKLELSPAIVVGHSLGGAVALQLALERPKLLRGLVLVDSAGLGPEISDDLLDRVEATPSRDEARRLLELFFQNPRFILDRGIDELHAARSAPGADEAVKAIAAQAFSRSGQQVAFLDQLNRLEVPLLIVWGELDRVVPARHAMAASIALPTAWLEILEGVGHVPQIEAAPAFTAIVRDWLESLPRP
ncbi:MAG: alpha/beta fold hydrolase [Thermomicrobiales bacterium]|nr:alpha/beta fold hydrolase [Thermomicrobiales bacterium]